VYCRLLTQMLLGSGSTRHNILQINDYQPLKQ
jgi:hypothetical protein